MNQNQSLISIVLPVRNAENSIQKCVKSLLSQTYRNIEIIAIDDKSTDLSCSILKNLRKKDKRLRVYKNKKQYGLSVCLNRAIKRSRGKYIAFMNQNDKSPSSRIKSQMNYLNLNPRTAVVGSQSVCFESCLINTNLLPKDALYFTRNDYPFTFIDVFLKISNYAGLAKITNPLYMRETYRRNAREIFGFFLTVIRLWLKSNLLYKEQFSFKSLLLPLIKETL
ncbi:glycosyltransferase [Patescibacteria group bacterium]|nr:glycosyltransferase [Patescibacteria group bacterium]MCL5010578.1 glycosyltransferase [Patescibacteria group bacterium]